jgi:hypothetical protein
MVSINEQKRLLAAVNLNVQHPKVSAEEQGTQTSSHDALETEP